MSFRKVEPADFKTAVKTWFADAVPRFGRIAVV